MPEIDNNQAAGEGTENKGAGAGEDQNKDADQNKKSDDTDTGDEDADDGEDKGGEGDKNSSKEDKKNAKAPDKGTQKDDEDDEDQEPEVRPRLNKQDFIIGRQRAKLAKKQEKQSESEDDKTGEDNEIAPEDEELISRVVSKKFAPIIDRTLAADDEREIQDFIKDNPDFKPFEAKARKFMQHPSRRSLPIKSIFYEVAGDKLLKLGAERAKAADAKAKETQTGGGSNRAGEGAGKNDWELSKDEFAAKQERIRRGQ